MLGNFLVALDYESDVLVHEENLKSIELKPMELEPTYLPTYLPTLPIYQPPYLPTCFPTYLPTYLPT